MNTTVARKLITGETLQVENLIVPAYLHLSEAARAAMDRKAMTLVVAENGVSYRVMFLGKLVKNSEVNYGIKEVCRDLNALARNGLIHSTVAPVSSIELAKIAGKELSSIVFSYVLVDDRRRKEAEQLTYHEVNETFGNDPSTMADLELPEGEFVAIERIAHVMVSLVGSARSTDAQIQERIQQYLTLLPKGTELVSVTPCAIVDLSFPFEIRFRNPLMAAYKEVAIEYVRSAAVVDGSLQQFNRITGVIYKRRDQEIA